MSRFTVVALLLVCFHEGFVYGMECSFQNDKNFIEKILTTCPRPFIDSSEESYCCHDSHSGSYYCCTFMEFTKSGFGVVFIPITIAAVIIIVLIVCCISCLCCSCCPWYRRRQGTVYGKVHAPIVQVIQPQANIPPSYINQAAQNNVPYPTGSTGMPQPPPLYNEAYAKQAAYNPAYPQTQ